MTMKKTTQAQDSLLNQLKRVHAFAIKTGEYDAADWLKYRMSTVEDRYAD